MATIEFLSSFDSYFRFTNLSRTVSASPVQISTTSTSLLDFNIIIIFVIIIIWSHFIYITAFFSKIFGHNRMNRGGGYGLEITVKYRLYGQEKIVKWLNKKLETVKKELQCKISVSLRYNNI